MKTKAELQKQLAEKHAEKKRLDAAFKDKFMSAEERQAYLALLTDIEGVIEEIKILERADSIDVEASVSERPRVGLEIHDVADEADYALGEFLQDVAKVGMGREKSPRLEKHQKRNLELVRREFKAASGLNEAVPAEGGFLVGQDFVGGIVKRTYANGVVAPLCQKVTVGAGSNGIKINAVDESSRADGSRHGGVRGYWVGEGGTLNASKPKFRQMEMTLKKLAVLYYSTDELLADATALGAVAEPAIADELNFKLQDAIILGDGAGKPQGILSSGCLVTVDKEAGQSADTINLANINKMWARAYGPGRLASVWLMNQEIEPQLDVLALPVGTGGVPAYMPPGGVADTPYGRLKGRPVIPIEQASALGDVGDLILADFSQYMLIDKGGVQAASSMHVQFLTDEMVFRFIYRVDGQATWSKTLTPYKGSGTLSPFVALAARP